MHNLLTALRAAGEGTRLRLLFLLSHGEFNVSELTRILGQSQPRVSRHLKLMTEAGLLDRVKEGSWVLFTLRADGAGSNIARAIVDMIPATDALIRRDRARANEILKARRELADKYFGENALNWDQIRSLHVAENQVEEALIAMAGPEKVAEFVDIGTGTGRILELLSGLAGQATGIDASREMLAIARARIEKAGLQNAKIRQGDIFSIPFEDNSCGLVSIHQVLHYLDNPAGALEEAGRILAGDGRLLIVDFAPHELEFLREEHAHRRLGIADEDMRRWCERAGMKVFEHRSLVPPSTPDKEGLTVSLWRVGKSDNPH